MRQVILRYWVILLFGTSLLAGCKQQAISGDNSCPPALANSTDVLKFKDIRAKVGTILSTGETATQLTEYLKQIEGKQVVGQGWITKNTSKNLLITIDLDDYEGDPTHPAWFPGITIVRNQSVDEWATGSPIFFSGTIQVGYQSNLFVSSSQICQLPMPNQRRITLTELICPMSIERCYTNGYTIFDNGTVLYTEQEWGTNKTITKTGQMSTTNFQQLVNAFEQINYFSLQDAYDNITALHESHVTTSITLEHKRKRIFHDYGDRTAPYLLTYLEQEIADAVHAIQYK